MTHYSHPGATARDPRTAEPSAPSRPNGACFVEIEAIRLAVTGSASGMLFVDLPVQPRRPARSGVPGGGATGAAA